MENFDNKITIRIADDHEIIIDGLTTILDFEKNIEIIDHSLNDREFLSIIITRLIDLLNII